MTPAASPSRVVDGDGPPGCYTCGRSGTVHRPAYCDLAPTLFDGVHIERDPGHNVASWNSRRRRLRFSSDGSLLANGAPLKFYHFTKIGGAGDVMTDRYAGAQHEPHELWRWYGRRLAHHAAPSVAKEYWHYGRFSDGVPIPRALRRQYRQRPDLMAFFDDPFDAESGLRAWFAENAPAVPAPDDNA